MNDSTTKLVKENQRMIDALKATQPTSLVSFGEYSYVQTVSLPAHSGGFYNYDVRITFTADNSKSDCVGVSASLEPEGDPLDEEFYSICGRNNGPTMRAEMSSEKGQVTFISGINLGADNDHSVSVQVISNEPGKINVEVHIVDA